MSQIGFRLAATVAFARPGNWFVSKIPPLLAIAYIDMRRFELAPAAALRLLGGALVSIFCVAIYGHVVNDMFDLKADRLADKVNRPAAMRPIWRWLPALGFLGAGFVPAAALHYPAGAVALLAFNYLWPTIYSVPHLDGPVCAGRRRRRHRRVGGKIVVLAGAAQPGVSPGRRRQSSDDQRDRHRGDALGRGARHQGDPASPD